MFTRKERESNDQVSVAQEDRIPPFRPLKDFISDATWNIPDFSNIERFNNRLINNLIYYQTNYFACSFPVTLFIGITHLQELFTSLAVIIVGCLAYTFFSSALKEYYSASLQRYPNNVKTAFPIVYLVILCVVIYIGLKLIYSLLVLTLSILIPILGILIHAMLRKRNIANKVANKLEKMKLGKTPMGRFLEAIGVQDF